MTGADAGAIVAMKVLAEQQMIPPVIDKERLVGATALRFLIYLIASSAMSVVRF